MDKSEVATILQEIATLLELQGDNPFKIRAYQNAARTLEGTSESLAELIEQDRLKTLKGFGTALVEKVTTLVTTGRLPYYEKLKSSLPAGLLDMLQIPGLGPKRARRLYAELGIKTIKQLETACRQGRLAPLEGFGDKSERKILEGIQFLKKGVGRHRFDEAWEEAQTVVASLKKLPVVEKIEIAGSLRRYAETIGDVDILISARKPKPIMDAFINRAGVSQVLAHGETKSSVVLTSGLQIDLRVIGPAEFPFALHYFTGSKDHNVAMRKRAQRKGLKLNEYGLFRGKKSLPCRSEKGIFQALGLATIPPELRESEGEIEAAEKGKIPKLVTVEDIRGIFHVHSSYSDGVHSLEEMIAMAQKLGLEYVGISDHSQSAYYAGGLKPDRVKRQRQEIDRLQKKYKIRIFHGTESDILSDGGLDYSKTILDSFDFVIGSIHSGFKGSAKEMTQRIITAIKNPALTMIGHLTGRLLLQREGYPVDHKAIIQAAADYGKTIELNASPHRFDLDWHWLPYAIEAGLKVPINPDAHRKEALIQYRYGVGIARKGWLTRQDVLTTLPVKQMEKYLAAH